MSTPDKPKHVPIQYRVIVSGIGATLLRTYVLLVALAWAHDFKFTDWLSIPDMESLLGLDWSNIKRHISSLKTLGLISWARDGKNRKRFFILEVRLEKGAKAQYCAPSSSSSNPDINIEDLLLARAQNRALGLTIDREAWEALRAVGVAEPTRSELADLPSVTANLIRAHVAGIERDFKSGALKGSRSAVLIYRLSNDWPAPNWCEHCNGLDGQHSDACPNRNDRSSDFNCSLPAHPEPANPGQAHIWRQVLDELSLQLTTATYDTWLRRTALLSICDGVYVIGVHNAQAMDWLENRLRSTILRALADVVGQPVQVRFVVNDEVEHESIATSQRQL